MLKNVRSDVKRLQILAEFVLPDDDHSPIFNRQNVHSITAASLK